ncbi:MAG: fumarylacetoacetate hydrolase family protein [Campylobacterota bacterium]
MKHIWFQDREVTPSKIVCIGRNYVEHIKELNNEIPKKPVIFNKPNSALSPVLYYFGSKCRFEGELCFLIEGKSIIGVGFGFDLTKVDEQEIAKEKGLPWERAKSFNASAVMSEFVLLPSSVEQLHFELCKNGAIVQSGGYELMMSKPRQIMQTVNEFMELEDGDIIMSGTPKGVGSYAIDDTFVARIYDGDTLLLESSFVVKPYPNLKKQT